MAINAIVAITAAATQACLMVHLRCERHLVRRSIDCNHVALRQRTGRRSGLGGGNVHD